MHPAKRVLIVDDHELIRKTLRSQFECEGFHVDVAENGVEGVAKGEELSPDLIVMDLTMPVMNGLDAAKVLLLSKPEVPIIMFSNTANAILAQDTQDAGICALISKADGLDKLIDKAKEILN